MFQMWQEVRPIMGSIRTPKPEYFKCGMVEFYVKNKEIHYKIWLWLVDGTSQFEYQRGKYESDEQIKRLIQSTLHNFSSVGVIEN